MTNTEFEARLRAKGVSQRLFAEITNTAPNTVSRWVTNRLPVPGWAKALLDAWDACPEALERARGGINKGE